MVPAATELTARLSPTSRAPAKSGAPASPAHAMLRALAMPFAPHRVSSVLETPPRPQEFLHSRS